jgi:hypothetical protein
MNGIVYYMPIYLKEKEITNASATEQLKDWNTLFNIVNFNASILDRTDTFKAPFATVNLYPIPEVKSTPNFGDLCIERAIEIINENKPIYLMYSGGLDSTSVLVAFTEAIKAGYGSFDQIIIATSPEAIPENPNAWWEIILPNYKIVNATSTLANIQLKDNRYVLGENADQLFGSDRVFTDTKLLYQEYTADNLKSYIESKVSRKSAIDWLHSNFIELANKCPLKITMMRDFFWWVNFTCKWQSVALRTLSFTNIFDNGARVSFDDIKQFATFFNTIPFQQLSMNGSLDKWGTNPTAYTYKQAARDFIVKYYPSWEQPYVSQKTKVGSLYNVVRQRKIGTDVIGYEDGYFYASSI